MRALLSILLLGGLAAALARADIMVTLDQAVQTGQAGQALQFFGSISNTGSSTVFLNGDDFTTSGSDINVSDQFFANVPVSLDPGMSSGDIELFDVNLNSPLSGPPGLYMQEYDLLGGVDGSAQNLLASAAFSVVVGSVITVSFDQPNQTGQPGQLLQFFGVISNTGPSTVYLNGDGFSTSGSDINVSDLFSANVPFFLGPGTNSGDIELFDAMIANPLSDPAGQYSAEYDLLGGVDGSAQDALTSAEFSVTTTPGVPQPTPEPAGVALLGAVIAFVLRSKTIRSRRTAKERLE